MSRPDWLLGIDFGTSNTAAAHTGAVSGAVEALQLSHNRTTMSSAVFVESPHQIAVGDVATNRAETNPAAYMPSPKRVIGQGVVNVNGYAIASSVPVAAVLDSVMARARAAHAGQAPAQLVLT
ncbi:MAG: Hsp70 family protein, partial [Pseudonocardia sp.]